MSDVSLAGVRARIDAAPMSRAQVVTVALTFVLSALDGFDVLSVTFAAPAISADWSIGKAALGGVLAAGLAGMALGALLLAPLADVAGRKAMLLVSLALMAAGMLGCAFAGGLTALIPWRVVTGLGIGACVAIINPIAAEFANARRRPLTIAVMAIGYPVGGVLGGVLAARLLFYYNWRTIFVSGFVAALLLIPVILLLLPESPSFLLTRPGARRLTQVNAVLARCGQPPLEMLPAGPGPTRRGYAEVFARGQRPATAWIAAVNILFVLTVYYVLSWLPQMVADAGFPPATASTVSATASLSGVAGGLLLGALAQRGGLRELTGGAVIGLGLATCAFGLVPPSLPLLLLAGGMCGFFLFGGSSGMYAVLATTFPDQARASGTGFVSGTGRVSSAIAPLLAGRLFAGGLSRAEVSLAFGAGATLAGLVLLLGWRRFRPR